MNADARDALTAAILNSLGHGRLRMTTNQTCGVVELDGQPCGIRATNWLVVHARLLSDPADVPPAPAIFLTCPEHYALAQRVPSTVVPS